MTKSASFKSILISIVILSFLSFSCGTESAEIFQPVTNDIQPLDYDPVFKEKPADPDTFDDLNNLVDRSLGEKESQRDLSPTAQENPNQDTESKKEIKKEGIKPDKPTECDHC